MTVVISTTAVMSEQAADNVSGRVQLFPGHEQGLLSGVPVAFW
jgi:hypothetical protein